MENKLYQSLRLMHLLGLTLFLGSIFSHIVVGQSHEAMTDPNALLFARKAISNATQFLTVPGLALSVITGIGMFWLRRKTLLGSRWFKIHVIIATLIVLITFIIMTPVVQELLLLANSIASGKVSITTFQGAAIREHVFGAINILLAVGAAYLGVFRPSFGKQK